MTWPNAVIVARAYLDQLNRSKSLSTAKASAIKSALDKADKTKPGKTELDAIDAMAAQVETDATSATGRDQMRMKALASTMKGRVASLR